MGTLSEMDRGLLTRALWLVQQLRRADGMKLVAQDSLGDDDIDTIASSETGSEFVEEGVSLHEGDSVVKELPAVEVEALLLALFRFLENGEWKLDFYLLRVSMQYDTSHGLIVLRLYSDFVTLIF